MNCSTPPTFWAIVLAAGSGTRMGNAGHGTAKQFLPWRGAPLYWASAIALYSCPLVEGIVFVFPKDRCEEETQRLRKLTKEYDAGVLWRVVAGGASRKESSYNGLQSVPALCKRILIHDAARPFLKPELVARICKSLEDENVPCVLPALPLTDTIKLAHAENSRMVQATLPRERLWAVQTPQGFKADLLRAAHDKAREENIEATDDGTLLEALGYPVFLCPGDISNVKITRPEDMKMLSENTTGSPRTGFGYDVHKYGPGRPLKLGGIEMPGNFEVIAHSDGDVLLHALMDAICGCAALGDIGQLFPDNDPSLEGISSAILLDQTLTLAKDTGIRLINADITIVAQKPKLSPMRDAIRRNVARLLSLPENCVNIKATTEEGLGFTGSVQGIKACAIVCAEYLPAHHI